MQIKRISVTVGQRVSDPRLPQFNNLNVETTIEALINESDDLTSAYLQLWQMAEQQSRSQLATVLAQGGLAAEQNSRAITPATPQGGVERPASDSQRKYIDKLVEKRNWTHAQLAAYCTEQGWDILTLTSREASDLIDALKDMQSDPGPTMLDTAPTSDRPQSAADDMEF